MKREMRSGGLQEVFHSLPEGHREGEERFEIALSHFFPDNPHVIVYRRIRASHLFGDRLPSAVRILQAQGLQEEEAFLSEVALVVLCHVEPVPTSESELYAFYVRLFQAMDEPSKILFLRMFSERSGAEDFLRLSHLEDKKNGSSVP